MRTGLLAVGAAMAIVGAGVVVAVTMPFGPAGDSKTDRVWQSTVAPSADVKHEMAPTPVGSAAVRFMWNSSSPTQVSWFVAGPCDPGPGWCFEGGPLYTWHDNRTGNWTWSGPPASGYGVLVVDPGTAPVNFSGEFVESYSDASHRLPMLPFALIVGGGSLLVAIGGLAIYLGLFLPSGVYEAEAPSRETSEPPGRG